MSCKVFIEASLLFVPSRSCIVSTKCILQALTPHVTKSLSVGSAAVTTSRRSHSMFRTPEKEEEQSKFWLLSSNCCLELVNIFGQFSPGTLKFTRELFIVWTNPIDEGDILGNSAIGEKKDGPSQEKWNLVVKQRELVAAVNKIPQLCPWVRVLKLHVNTDMYYGISFRSAFATLPTSKTNNQTDNNNHVPPYKTAVSFFLPPPSSENATNDESFTYDPNYFFTGFPFLQEFADTEFGTLMTENYNEALLAICAVARTNLHVLEMSCYAALFDSSSRTRNQKNTNSNNRFSRFSSVAFCGMNPEFLNFFFGKIVSWCPFLEKISIPNYVDCAQQTMFDVENSIISNLSKLRRLQHFPGFYGKLKESIAMEFASNCGESLTHLSGFGPTFEIVADDWRYGRNNYDAGMNDRDVDEENNNNNENDEDDDDLMISIFSSKTSTNKGKRENLFSEFFETLLENARNLQRLSFPQNCRGCDLIKFADILSSPPPMAAFFKKTDVKNPLCFTLQTLSLSNLSSSLTESEHYGPIFRNLENLKYLLISRCPGFTGAESFKEIKNKNNSLVCVYLRELENFSVDAIYHIGINAAESLQECFIDVFPTGHSPVTMSDDELKERRLKFASSSSTSTSCGFKSWGLTTPMKKLRTLSLGEAGWRDEDLIELGKAFRVSDDDGKRKEDFCSCCVLESLSITVADPRLISDRGLTGFAPIIVSLKSFSLQGPTNNTVISENSNVETALNENEKVTLKLHELLIVEQSVTGKFLKKWAEFFCENAARREEIIPKLEQITISSNIGFFTDFTSHDFFEGLEFFGARSLKKLELSDDIILNAGRSNNFNSSSLLFARARPDNDTSSKNKNEREIHSKPRGISLQSLLTKRKFFVCSEKSSSSSLHSSIRGTNSPHIILFSTATLISLLLKMTKLKYVKIPHLSEQFMTETLNQDNEKETFLFWEEFKQLNAGIRKITKDEAISLVETLNLHEAPFLFRKDAVEEDFIRENNRKVPGRIVIPK